MGGGEPELVEGDVQAPVMRGGRLVVPQPPAAAAASGAMNAARRARTGGIGSPIIA